MDLFLFLFTIASLMMLYFGADFLISGALSTAARLKISEMVVSITLIAWATSVPELFVGVGSGPHVHPRRHHQVGLANHCPDNRTDGCMWQLPPQRVKQPPRQGVEPPPDIVRPPAEANPAHLPTINLHRDCRQLP